MESRRELTQARRTGRAFAKRRDRTVMSQGVHLAPAVSPIHPTEVGNAETFATQRLAEVGPCRAGVARRPCRTGRGVLIEPFRADRGQPFRDHDHERHEFGIGIVGGLVRPGRRRLHPLPKGARRARARPGQRDPQREVRSFLRDAAGERSEQSGTGGLQPLHRQAVGHQRGRCEPRAGAVAPVPRPVRVVHAQPRHRDARSGAPGPAQPGQCAGDLQ